MVDWTEYIKIFTALLSIVDPIAAVPVFVGLTAGMTPKERYGIARITATAVAAIMIGAALCGKMLLEFFGISIASFRVGGGIIILLMAIAMMQARTLQNRQSSEEAAEAEDKESIGVVPLAMPLLAGPGAISTVIIYSHTPFQPVHLGMIILISLVVALITWITLRIAYSVSQRMSKTAINIATRLMGLLLAAISIEFISGGLIQLFPGLGR